MACASETIWCGRYLHNRATSNMSCGVDRLIWYVCRQHLITLSRRRYRSKYYSIECSVERELTPLVRYTLFTVIYYMIIEVCIFSWCYFFFIVFSNYATLNLIALLCGNIWKSDRLAWRLKRRITSKSSCKWVMFKITYCKCNKTASNTWEKATVKTILKCWAR